MSSFKRKVTSKTQEKVLPGTKPLPGSSSSLITSTGIPSLDDILGGGLPLTCSQLILTPDAHSAYGELVQKYFVSQGLACRQDVYVVHERAREFVEGCMWVPGGSVVVEPEPEDVKDASEDSKIKIAWRYEQMKQFQTTVSSSKEDDYCRVFDLTSRIPAELVDAATTSKQLATVDPSQERSVQHVLGRIAEILGPEEESTSRKPLRICIPSLGSPAWGDLEPQNVCYFLYSLRSLLRRHTHACASISLSPDLCEETYGGSGWIRKLGWLTDGCISLSAFAANPSLSATFPSYHGFVHIHSLPAPLSLVPASDKFSSLRGLSSSGENNLAFKCMRKRLVVETLHLDLEGGVSERRTTPATSTSIETTIPPRHESGHDRTHDHAHTPHASGVVDRAVVEIQLETAQKSEAGQRPEEVVETTVAIVTAATTTKKPKQRKKVAFTSDRPDLYDF